MLVRLQFIVNLGVSQGYYQGTALAWPEMKYGNMQLTHEPLDSIGYGSEAVAIADLDRWLAKFPCITEAETVVLGDLS
jgi:hypothetical protein